MALSALSLCAGVAGIDLGLNLADPTIRTVCYVEWSHFPAAVIAARIEDEALDDAPIWDDVGTFDGRPWRGVVDIVTAGFPCQPVSLAGKRLGMADERFIWGDVARIIGEVRPRYVFLENVPGILTADGGAFLGRVFGDLVELGFDCEWDLFSAEETGAPHKRQRWFCLAYAASDLRRSPRHDRSVAFDRASGDALAYAPLRGLGTGGFAPGRDRQPDSGDRPLADAGHGLVPQPGRRSQGRNGTGPASAVLGDAAVRRCDQALRVSMAETTCTRSATDDQAPRGDVGPRAGASVYPPARNDHAGWAAVPPGLEPAVCRDADGLAAGLDPSLFAYRNDRLRAVGNGVVPLTAAIAWIELNRRIRE